MSIRFSDNILGNIQDTGFIVRDRIPRSLQILLLFLGIFDLICFSAYLTDDSGVNITFLIVLLSSLGLLGGIIFFLVRRFHRVILATEFQNAMFASATQIGTRFCFITNSDGLLFYVDYGFQKVFANFVSSGSRTLKELTAFTEMSKEISNSVFETLKKGKSSNFVWSFKDASGAPVTMVTTIDAIARPKGYFMIRGRDYVQKRVADKPDDKDMLMDSLSLLQQTLYNLAGGIIVADHHGRVVHVNGEMEKWLGYDPGEIMNNPLLIKQVFYQYVGYEVGTMLLNNFDGDVILSRKDHTMATVKLHQRALTRDGHTIGICAIADIQSGA